MDNTERIYGEIVCAEGLCREQVNERQTRECKKEQRGEAR